MTVIINERRITDDSPDIKIAELDMSLCESVNIDGNASLSAITITVFDTQSVLHFMTDYYDYKPVRILDDLHKPLFDGIITESETEGKRIKLTAHRNIDLALNGFLSYEATNQNPVIAVKNIIESIGGIVDVPSYNRIKAIFDTSGSAGEVSVNLSYLHISASGEVFDEKTALDAINDICSYCHFYIYYSNGNFYFYELSDALGEIKIRDGEFYDVTLSYATPKLTKLLVEWEGGTSIAEFEGNTDRYGVIEQTADVSRAQNVMLNNLDYVGRIFDRYIGFYGYAQKYIEFASSKNLDLQYLYNIIVDGIPMNFRIINKEIKDKNTHAYKGVLI